MRCASTGSAAAERPAGAVPPPAGRWRARAQAAAHPRESHRVTRMRVGVEPRPASHLRRSRSLAVLRDALGRAGQPRAAALEPDRSVAAGERARPPRPRRASPPRRRPRSSPTTRVSPTPRSQTRAVTLARARRPARPARSCGPGSADASRAAARSAAGRPGRRRRPRAGCRRRPATTLEAGDLARADTSTGAELLLDQAVVEHRARRPRAGRPGSEPPRLPSARPASARRSASRCPDISAIEPSGFQITISACRPSTRTTSRMPSAPPTLRAHASAVSGRRAHPARPAGTVARGVPARESHRPSRRADDRRGRVTRPGIRRIHLRW